MAKNKKAKNKRIFLVGKTREFDENDQKTFENEVKKDVKEMTDKELGFGVTVVDAKKIVLNFPVSVDFSVDKGYIPEVLAILLMGLGVEYPVHTMGYFSTIYNVSDYKGDIEDTYKRNARHYKASSLRNVDISYNPTSGLSLTLEFR